MVTAGAIAEHFAALDDPHPGLEWRRHCHLWHHLRGQFLGAIRALVCWFKSFLCMLPGGIPSHDTFGEPGAFQPWVLKPWRGRWWPSTARRCGALMTAPWASRPSTWLTLMGRPTAWCWARPRWQKSPMTAIQLLELAGCSRRMGCQKEIAQQIIGG